MPFFKEPRDRRAEPAGEEREPSFLDELLGPPASEDPGPALWSAQPDAPVPPPVPPFAVTVAREPRPADPPTLPVPMVETHVVAPTAVVSPAVVTPIAPEVPAAALARHPSSTPAPASVAPAPAPTPMPAVVAPVAMSSAEMDMPTDVDSLSAEFSRPPNSAIGTLSDLMLPSVSKW
ncbi:MAG TPA: hypothetical protein VKR22_02615, partial [Acidimicrobiales bacterium]|nr:hypothetical protein [Acidimicrobiales bacterium]